jgi:hypothetical protein
MVFIFVTLLFHKNKQNPTNNNVFLLFFFFTDFRLRQQGVKMKKETAFQQLECGFFIIRSLA